MRKQLSAKQITSILHGHFYRQSEIVIPRYTPRDWWECDLWRLTKSGMVDEYEIKLSTSDFKADASKDRVDFKLIPERGWLEQSYNKHAELAAGERGPNRFWFVMPAEIADKVEVPQFAGLIVIESWLGVSVRSRAPKRHNRKWNGDRLILLMKFYHRYWHHEAVKVETAEPLCE